MSEDRIAFTRSSAQRIAKVVRIVEAGDRSADPIRIGERLQDFSANKSIKFVSWPATWEYGGTATITFTSSATATAKNVFLGVAPGVGWVAKNGTTGWSLVSVDLTRQPGYASGDIQLFGHNASAVATWYSITSCATATAGV